MFLYVETDVTEKENYADGTIPEKELMSAIFYVSIYMCISIEKYSGLL